MKLIYISKTKYNEERGFDNMIKSNKLMCFFGILSIIVFTIIVANSNSIYTVRTNAKNGLSNTKIGWGIKRGSNNEQPEIGEVNKAILDEYNGIYMGGIDSKSVYLTFDAGYEAGYTEKILEVLKQNDVRATFFLTAHYINTSPDLVKRMIDEGHIIGNHTVNHKSMPDIENEAIKKEVMDLHTAVYEKFNYEMKYIRPPKGEYSQRTVAYTNTLGYTTVMWSFAYDDWDEAKQGRESYGKEKILKNMHNGAVILLHSTSKDNANILDECIKKIKDKGYEFKNIDKFFVGD